MHLLIDLSSVLRYKYHGIFHSIPSSNHMLSTRTLTSRLSSTLSKQTLAKATLPSFTSTRSFTHTPTTMGKDSKMPTGPPKHEMKYFPGLTSDVRAFGQFRKVMHTGLYSQLVSMEIPPGGDIGNEVHTVDQVLIFTSGEAKAIVAGEEKVCSALSQRMY